METRNKRTKVIVGLLALAGVAAFSLTAGGESLEFSAPLGLTKKTLDEVEPRTPILKLPYTISSVGSYYLAGDLSSDANGIIVDANNVTIDLAGFRIIGPGSGINYGIYMNGRRNVEIRNGTVQGFTGTYQQGGGIFEAKGTGHRVVGLRAVSNGRGIVLGGSGHLIKDCSVVENKSYGIHVGKSSTVTGNTCYGNHDRGISAYGSCTVTGNTCWRNWIGIQVLDGSTVIGNAASKNEHSGIRVRMGCLVRNNTLRGNDQYNIYVEQPGNTVEENLVTNSPNGIYFGSGGNFYSDNRASGNTTDYNDPGDNMDGGGNYSF